ncbi:transposase [Pelomonas sp. CA6]|uniref:transposase n=1 Tax=Pelomonas sp. CA6 TaxID=2907999 RepID=UPI001F4BA307|nr:transposase [Pelomonas sp. CA6]MCH7342541.1 transposase [Pelomonas sp. CA6]
MRVKSVEQDALHGLHRIRSLWMGTRTSRINALRGFCRELGRIAQVERELANAARHSPACTLLLRVPGIGLLTATAMVAATSGDVTHFQDARHFASWFGLTPREFSSGGTRHLGPISKKGDRYLRMLLTHGARSVLRAATAAVQKGKVLGGVRQWALQVQARSNPNKATCALANKLARICYATLRDHATFDEKAALERMAQRQSFAMPA